MLAFEEQPVSTWSKGPCGRVEEPEENEGVLAFGTLGGEVLGRQ